MKMSPSRQTDISLDRLVEWPRPRGGVAALVAGPRGGPQPGGLPSGGRQGTLRFWGFVTFCLSL